ncbi:hypothetical protein ABID65_003957 [Bradyrhizobium sp. S3.9.2]
MSAEALAKADVGEGGAKRRMRGCFREFNRERVARGGNPSSVSPPRGEPPSRAEGEGKNRNHNFVAERDNNFHSSPCFSQFIRM